MSLQPAGTLAEFEAFCAELAIEDGSPFCLYPEQRAILEPYFDWATEVVVILSKKNGKTTLMAALALYHLLSTPNAECIIVAAAREQAEIVLRQARMFIRQSKALQAHVRVQQRSILSNLDEGRIRVLASDEDTADGVIPTLAIVDELHRHKTGALYGVLRDGLGPRNGKIITISTAGSRLESPLGEIRQRARLLPTFARDGKFNFARSETLAFLEWCLDPDDDPDDMAVVKMANPAPWHTQKSLRGRRESETMTPWQWLRFACGVWTEGEEPWIEPGSWDKLSDPAIAIERGERVWLGVDIGVRHDCTGIIIASPRDRFVVRARIMKPLAGGALPLERVEDELRELAQEYQVARIVYDPWSFRRSAEILEAEGLPMEAFPQTPEKMSMASATLYRLIESGELAHDGALDLRAHVLAGRVKQTERGWRLQKDPRGRWAIDALIALAMVAHVATETKDVGRPSVRIMEV